ncbi:RagB/SusD family nutrient uptake outer membrane protein [Saccharicrinis fermentans]|uniref:SusD family protein n=1 Tax=Saccharicrinis fermentans DSM 9555 = JCM 21142 TaxID=869213 RepID=W7XYR5_9BACT|nr:RagB/SusD family nutrient uptake outer membrane protein [Saccharicrinis fermentans]GAF03780.1 SusD family protein [Saccharicrinis fermentans DSM 9555 = JCM 21142]
MKIYNIKTFIIAILIMGIGVSCDDFLDRAAEDTYTIDSFYQDDDQLFQAVNTIYNSPWYDFQRGFMKIGDVLAGNIVFDVGDGYTNFTLNNSDVDIANASASLWSVNAYCNGVIQNVDTKSGSEVTQYAKNTVKGEAMVWKAMSYFYLVRCFGAVPIIHDNAEIISSNSSTTLKRNKIQDVYKYITLILKDAIELLPESNDAGRIDRYSACGLLAKVYLTKAGYGQNNTRNEDDLAEAAKYAKLVIDQSGRSLHPAYEELFQLKGNFNTESLIAWHWTVGAQWTSQNSLQSDLSMANFSDAVQSWGGYVYPTIDLQNEFDEDATSLTRKYRDTRRKATMMMVGDTYDYWWTEMGGFIYNWDSSEEGMYKGSLSFVSGTGANCAKHIVGRLADAKAQGYSDLDRMHTPLSTHLLRLADVYLIYAEAVLGNDASSTDAAALSALNAVRARALQGNHVDATEFTFDDIDKERRLELAFEGDRWYDLVRLHYYKPEKAKQMIAAQNRGSWDGLDDLYTNDNDANLNLRELFVTPSDVDFVIPFPEVDLSLNPGLMDDPVDFDFGSIGYN